MKLMADISSQGSPPDSTGAVVKVALYFSLRRWSFRPEQTPFVLREFGPAIGPGRRALGTL